MTKLKDNIIKKIEAGQVAMRPKWQFVLKTLLMFIGVLLIAFSLVYIVSYIVFVLKYTGAAYGPMMGTQGALVFLFSAPWTLIALALLFIIILEILVQKFSFGYRKPLLYSALGIIAVATLGTLILLQTPLHQRIQEKSEKGGVPLLGKIYREFGENPRHNIRQGIIDSVTAEGFVLNDYHYGLLTIKINEETRLPKRHNFVKDMIVVVFGEEDDGTIYADGVAFPNGSPRPMPMRR